MLPQKLKEIQWPNYNKKSFNLGIPVGAPLYGLYRYVRPPRVWFFSRFVHKKSVIYSNFSAILVINRASIFALRVFNSLFFFFRRSYFFITPSFSRSALCLRLRRLTPATQARLSQQQKPFTNLCLRLQCTKVSNRVSTFWSGQK